MPTATPELQAKMREYFGDPTNDYGPTNFLFARGWKNVKGSWRKPSLSHQPDQKEWDCVEFLCQEWDDDFDPTRAA